MRSQSTVVERDVSGLPAFDAIRAHLERVITSREFVAAPRLARFLTFVVETALAGQGDQIKESLIAIEVYGRRPDYNPQIDSTVRVEAGRLRSRLRRYYESSGELEPIRIEIPKGSYAPVFEQLAECQASQSRTAIGTLSPASPSLTMMTGAPPSRYALFGLAALVITSLTTGLTLVSYSRSNGNGSLLSSVAVLPFVNLSDDSSTEGFCEGLTEDLTIVLARNPRLRVPSRSSMNRHKHQTADVGRIGKEHGVRAVLEGSVRRTGERIVVTTRLIDTSSGYHLWAERYERDGDDVAKLHAEVASKIVSGVSEAFKADPGRRAPFDVDPKTMELYHRAQELLRIPVLKDGVPEKLPDSITESVRLFEDVVARSPQFARGWAGLAEASEWEYELRGNRPPQKLATARAAIRRAIDLEPELTEAWTILTSILFFRDWNIPEAESACRRAIELEPRNTAARQRYVDLLRIQGRTAEARFEIDQAIQLQPTTAAYRVRRAVILYQSGEYEEALKEGKASGALTNQMPHYPMSLWVQGLSLQQMGRLVEAEKLFRKSLAFQPHDPWNEPSLGYLLAVSGRTTEAENILAELRGQLARGRLTHVAMALMHTGLGRHGEALSSLEQGLAAREDSILFVPLDPRLRPLHSQPRFRELVARLRGTAS